MLYIYCCKLTTSTILWVVHMWHSRLRKNFWTATCLNKYVPGALVKHVCPALAIFLPKVLIGDLVRHGAGILDYFSGGDVGEVGLIFWGGIPVDCGRWRSWIRWWCHCSTANSGRLGGSGGLCGSGCLRLRGCLDGRKWLVVVNWLGKRRWLGGRRLLTSGWRWVCRDSLGSGVLEWGGWLLLLGRGLQWLCGLYGRICGLCGMWIISLRCGARIGVWWSLRVGGGLYCRQLLGRELTGCWYHLCGHRTLGGGRIGSVGRGSVGIRLHRVWCQSYPYLLPPLLGPCHAGCRTQYISGNINTFYFNTCIGDRNSYEIFINSKYTLQMV